MHRPWICAIAAASFSLLSVMSAAAQDAQRPQIRPETWYPRHAPPGRATVINVAIPSAENVRAAELSPSTGITVSGIKGVHSGSEQNIGWWEIALDVAKDASPGDRTLVLTTQMGTRTAPITIAIPTHDLTLSDLRVTSSDLQLRAADAAGDLRNTSYVWFTADCGGEPLVGAIPARVNGGVVRATLPDLRAGAADVPAAARCDLQVHMTDATGIESNTLKTAFELPRVSPSAPVSPLPAPASAAQDWNEFASREDRFTITFPGQPTITETTWVSQYFAILPGRIYRGTQGPARYSVTAIDYNPIERLLCERSRALPALDLAVHVYGPGYWKTDLRGAVVYAAAKYLERDGKVSHMMSNFADLVPGVQLQFTSNADRSVTFVSIYMHANRLVIAEATAPRGYPAPLIFQQSLGWLDEQGRRVRYPYMNYNEPDGPEAAAGGR